MLVKCCCKHLILKCLWKDLPTCVFRTNLFEVSCRIYCCCNTTNRGSISPRKASDTPASNTLCNALTKSLFKLYIYSTQIIIYNLGTNQLYKTTQLLYETVQRYLDINIFIVYCILTLWLHWISFFPLGYNDNVRLRGRMWKLLYAPRMSFLVEMLVKKIRLN